MLLMYHYKIHILKKKRILNRLSASLKELIQKSIIKHHEIYNIPIKAEYWEYILHNAFIEDNKTSIWDSNSHAVGTDIVCNGVNISCKSGNFTGNSYQTLNISSYRTTKHKTLNEKIKYISLNHEDVIFSLVYFEYDKLYRVHIINPLDFKTFKWEKRNGNYFGKQKGTKHTAKIAKSMSDQLWIYFHYESLLDECKYYDFKLFE